jgi:hypothetical protein
MEDKQQYEAANQTPQKKGIQKPKRITHSTKPKHRTTKVILGTVAAGLLLVLLQVFESPLHKFLYAFPCILLACWTLYTELRDHEATKRKKARFFTPKASSVMLFALAELVCIYLFIIQPRHQAKPHPEFSFSVRSMNEPSTWVELTNKFLIHEGFGATTNETRGALYIPVRPGQSNLTLHFSVTVGPKVEAESAQIIVNLPKQLGCVMNAEWRKVEVRPLSVVAFDRSGQKTIEMESWGYFVPFTILPGNSVETPFVKLCRLPMFDKSFFSMSVFVRAKNADAKEVSFFLFTLPVSPNRSHAPFVVEGKNDSEGGIVFLSIEEEIDLQK